MPVPGPDQDEPPRGAPAGSQRKPLGYIISRYNRVARVYRPLEPLFGILPLARRKAVAALALRPGDTVLEIGAGTGRNLALLLEAVGPAGTVLAVDASPGMLRQARRVVRRRGWPNVRLIEQDAARLALSAEVDAVLFSLSYSAMPDPQPAVARAWDHLRPAGHLTVMDAGLTHTPLRLLLAPVARLLILLGPGDPYSQPWDDLAEYGPVTTDRFLAGIYYTCTIRKPARAWPGGSPARRE
jgi:S-adenosylmethionine-diacylgycerolhomoserine-N-methlytransferase